MTAEKEKHSKVYEIRNHPAQSDLRVARRHHRPRQRQRHLQHRPNRADRPQRCRQVHPAPSYRGRAAADLRPHRRWRRGRLPAADAHAATRHDDRRAARHQADPRCDEGDRVRRRRPTSLRRDRRRLGHRVARRRSAAPDRVLCRRPRPPGRRGVRRRGDAHRDHRTAHPSYPDHAARRAHQQPRPHDTGEAGRVRRPVAGNTHRRQPPPSCTPGGWIHSAARTARGRNTKNRSRPLRSRLHALPSRH